MSSKIPLSKSTTRLALITLAMLGLGACAPDADLQDAQQNVSAARAKLMADEATGDQAQISTDATQLANAKFILVYDRMQWPGDSLGHSGNHARPH